MYAAWFLYTVFYYNSFTPNCYEPYPSFGLFVFCIVMVLILPAAFLVICIGSFLVLFCPCIAYTLVKAFADARATKELKERVIKNLSKITYSEVNLQG